MNIRIAFQEIHLTKKLWKTAKFWNSGLHFVKTGAIDYCWAGLMFSCCSYSVGGMWFVNLHVWKITLDLQSPIFELKLDTC